jgi:hypothetical protein
MRRNSLTGSTLDDGPRGPGFESEQRHVKTKNATIHSVNCL